MDEGGSLLSVSIDFEQSHLFFPNIIHWFLLILALLIVITHGPRWVRKWRQASDEKETGPNPLDWIRLLGTLILTVAYFSLMETVGDLFPNTGLGFLFTSIPFMFLLSLLYVHQRGRQELVTIALSAVISPTLAWYVLAQMLDITLP